MEARIDGGGFRRSAVVQKIVRFAEKKSKLSEEIKQIGRRGRWGG